MTQFSYARARCLQVKPAPSLRLYRRRSARLSTGSGDESIQEAKRAVRPDAVGASHLDFLGGPRSEAHSAPIRRHSARVRHAFDTRSTLVRRWI